MKHTRTYYVEKNGRALAYSLGAFFLLLFFLVSSKTADEGSNCDLSNFSRGSWQAVEDVNVQLPFPSAFKCEHVNYTGMVFKSNCKNTEQIIFKQTFINRLLQGRRIIFLGDSLSMQHYLATIATLGRMHEVRDRKWTFWTMREDLCWFNISMNGKLKSCFDVQYNGFSVHLRIPQNAGTITPSNIKAILDDLNVGEYSGDVLVFNFGAHYNLNVLGVKKIYYTSMKWLFKYLSTDLRGSPLLVFREYNPVHFKEGMYAEGVKGCSKLPQGFKSVKILWHMMH